MKRYKCIGQNGPDRSLLMEEFTIGKVYNESQCAVASMVLKIGKQCGITKDIAIEGDREGTNFVVDKTQFEEL